MGPLGIAGACLAWAIDNNLTRRVSAGDPVQIAALKGLIAGAVNLSIAFIVGARLSHFPAIVTAASIGFLGYGVSLTLFVLALRHIGTARTGAYFSLRRLRVLRFLSPCCATDPRLTSWRRRR